MAGRKPKPDREKMQALNARIEQTERRQAKDAELLSRLQKERAELAAKRLVGDLSEHRMTFPELHSLLQDLHERTPPEMESGVLEEPIYSDQLPENEVSQCLTVRVTQQESRVIDQKMKLARYNRFNSYARKMLVDGYVITWDFTELKNLSHEIGSINRNMNQIVKRANQTGSIYAGDFGDFRDEWQTMKGKIVSLLHQLSGREN